MAAAFFTGAFFTGAFLTGAFLTAFFATFFATFFAAGLPTARVAKIGVENALAEAKSEKRIATPVFILASQGKANNETNYCGCG